MRIFRHFEDLTPEVRGGAVAVGNFDGVHLGHRAVVGGAGAIARAGTPPAPWGVLTFEPHPRLFFKPDQPPFRLTPLRIKARHVEALGVDFMLVLHFDHALASLDADTFVTEVIVGALDARHVVAGHDFVFGRGRRGDGNLLLRMGGEAGFKVTRVPPVTGPDGAAYSSTRVRERLAAGDPRGAEALLGRPFEIEGRVEHGDARGREIGFPTANLPLGEYQRPALGVYAVRAGIDLGRDTLWRDGVANLGRRPTFDGHDTLLEAHLFDTREDLYGRHLRVRLIEYLRPERRFDGIDALKAQIAEDCARARAILDGLS